MTRGYRALRRKVAAWAVLLTLAGGFLAPAGALAGDFDGVPDATLEAIAQELRAGRDAAAQAEALRAQVAALQTQVDALLRTVAELRDAEGKRALAAAVAEDRDRRRQEVEDALRSLLDRHEKLLEKVMARNESMEKRAFWMQILAPIMGLLGLVAGALLL